MDRSSFKINQLRFAEGRLYGRELEEKKLRDIYRQVVHKCNGRASTSGDDDASSLGSKTEMVFITGASGTGKTALARTLRDSSRKRGDYFLSGKFDARRRMVPYSAIGEALSDLPNQLTDGADLARLRERMGAEVSRVIARCVPALSSEDALGVTASSKDGGKLMQFSPTSQAQVNFAFRSLFRHICGEKNKKIVIFYIDDLQCE